MPVERLTAAQEAVCEDVRAFRQGLWERGFRPVAVYSPNANVEGAGNRPAGRNVLSRAKQDPPAAVTEPANMAALNTGVLCDGLCVLKFDLPENLMPGVWQMTDDFLGKSCIVRWRSNKTGFAAVYNAGPDLRPRACLTMTGEAGSLEVRGSGRILVMDGTTSDGHCYIFSPSLVSVRALSIVSEAKLVQFLGRVAETLKPPMRFGMEIA